MIDESIFKAYDIRGIYPDQIDADGAYKIGQGYASFVKPTKPVAVGRDVRLHSEELQQALIKGLTDAGVDVVDIGLISTEMLYFAVGNYGYGGGISSTASHNPAQWHGFKLVRENVIPLSGDSGINEIKEFVKSGQKITSQKKGKIEKKDILDDFCHYLLTWIDKNSLKKIRLVYNPNFGFEGVVLKKLVEMGNLPTELIPLNADPDGSFPKGPPDPSLPQNRIEFIDLVKNEKADLGVTWDADADRVFFCTGDGTFVEPYYMNTILIRTILKNHPNEKVIYDPRYNWALVNAITESGGIPVLCRVGHSLIKAKMREVNAIFSGESSGHTFFRDFWISDSGMIPFLLIWKFISSADQPLSSIVNSLAATYPISGEINFKTENKDKIMEMLPEKYSDAQIDRTDGISLEYPNWRASVRTSNTESLLRLNVEAKTKELMEQKRDELTKVIKDNS